MELIASANTSANSKGKAKGKKVTGAATATATPEVPVPATATPTPVAVTITPGGAGTDKLTTTLADDSGTPKIQPIPVTDKPLQVDIDLGNLLLSDPNEVSSLSFRANPNKYMKKITQENAQLLFNKIWTLPFERVDDVVIAKLPKPKLGNQRNDKDEND